jgi:16S rRNA (cytosine1402-N4)-methyltransferase
MAPAPYHVPVLASAVVTALTQTPPGPLVDGTLGGGGHLAALADARGDGRRLIGVDRDPEALVEAGRRLAGAAAVTLVHGNFGDLRAALAAAGIEGDHQVAGILLDLGVSSHQLDEPGRGFAIKHPDAPLDMRMDATSGGQTARELIDALDPGELAALLRELGEVSESGRVARAIKEAADAGDLETTGDLARVVEGAVRQRPGRRGVHPATTVFQALRIAVNGELDALAAALAQAPALLMAGGRLAVIAYHSLEDRRVKQAFRQGEQGPERPGRLPPPSDWQATWKVVTRKPISAGEAEVAANPRARSARLRIAERAPLTRERTGGGER